MLEAKIIDRGRGPRNRGDSHHGSTDVLDYHKSGWHRDMIGGPRWSSVRKRVEVAIRYIEEHRNEVMADYEEMLARDTRGNPPELQAKLDAMRGTARARP